MSAYRISFIILLIVFLSMSLQAQDLPGRITATKSPDAQSITTVSNYDNLLDATDVFYGNNTRGPFFLSWKPVARDSEQIIVSASLMQDGIDYDIDYASGMIAFKEPVPTGEKITVNYRYDPTIATSNKGALNIPLSLDLYSKDNAQLQLIGAVKQDGSSNSSAPSMAIFGLSGNKKSNNTEITSMILLDAAKDSGTGADDAAFSDKSAMSIGAKASIDKLSLSSTYQRAGADFASAKDYQLQQGKEILDFAAAYQANKYLSISSSYKKTSDIANTLQSEEMMTHGIAYSKEGLPSLTATRTEVNKAVPGSDEQKTVANVLRLEHKLDEKTTAVASHNDTITEIGPTLSKSATDQLTLSSRLSNNLGASAYVKKMDVTGVGRTDVLGLNIDNQPSRNLSLKAGITRSDNEIVGADNAETLSLAATPYNKVNAVFDLTHRDTDAFGDELVKNALITATPKENMKIQLNWQDKHSDAAGNEDIGKLYIETAPIEKVRLAGSIEEKDTTTSNESNKEARIALNPSPSVTLGGAYMEREANGDIVSTAKEATMSVKPAKTVQLSTQYKTRDFAGQDPLDTVNLTLSLMPVKTLQLSGSYSTNPETKQGTVQMLRSQSLALSSDFGKLKLKGSYSLNDEYLLGRVSNRTEITMNLLLSGDSSITTGVSIDRLRYDVTEKTAEFSLGYTKKAGSDLNLYIGGKLKTYEREDSFTDSLTEYQAEAKIGLKF